ncbi:hypothetical protein [Clostridium aminobutyricum]|uniref:Uncharacterized protein n=1 Tax=Clostridium aminobutyricum TaxID=33953 RepID=A0A939D7U4_CLOAM|nr:hypothetical protein [Clostridium aminobutyricum]MBN7772670.1 hypothetical protein [Clostridium aminobutyricum]
MKNFFANWNYKKHAKFVTAIYAVLYAIDMTFTYCLIKKLNKNDWKLKCNCKKQAE